MYYYCPCFLSGTTITYSYNGIFVSDISSSASFSEFCCSSCRLWQPQSQALSFSQRYLFTGKTVEVDAKRRGTRKRRGVRVYDPLISSCPAPHHGATCSRFSTSPEATTSASISTPDAGPSPQPQLKVRSMNQGSVMCPAKPGKWLTNIPVSLMLWAYINVTQQN